MTNRIDGLARIVQKQRSRWQQLQLLEGAGLAVAGVVAYFLAVVLLDNFARLPVAGRWFAALGFVAAWVWCGRLAVLRWRKRHATEDEVALAIEGRTPGGFQNRLINTLQIGRLPAPEHSAAGSSAELRDALVQENWRHLQERPLPGALTPRPAVIATSLAAGLVLALVVGWLWQPARFSTAASRILLPFASIDPVYRTVLVVSPGDIEAAGDVTIHVKIRGERPAEIAVLLSEQDRRSTQIVPVDENSNVVTYTIPGVQKSLTYAVRGGDFTSPSYRIDVPTPARLIRVQATYRFPEYTRLTERTVETAGDLEAVQGTQAALVFVLDRPADEATLVFRSGAANSSKGGQRATAPDANGALEKRLPLKQKRPAEFDGALSFDDVVEYRLETRQGSRPPHTTAWHSVRVIRDEPPKLELTGLPVSGEIALDTPLPLQLSVIDDFGLTQYGVYARLARKSRAAEQASQDAKAERKDAEPKEGAKIAGTGEAAAQDQASDGWKAIGEWRSNGETKVAQVAEFLPLNLGAAEGDRLEIIARAMESCPERLNQWTLGPVHTVCIAGDGAQLQLLYEQILRSEAELTALVAGEQQLYDTSNTLVRRLEADPQVDGNVPEKVKELLEWATGQLREQGKVRETASRTAKEMVAAAGNLRLSLGMLADTEMIRAVRVLESVATRDDAAGRRTAITEARATQQRILQSLQQIQEQYVRFRQEWELAHMTPFVKMLADRQALLRDESRRRAEAGTGATTATHREASARRQAKVAELCGLAATAFSGLAERTQEIESELASVFATTAETLTSDQLKTSLAAAGMASSTGDWTAAASQQTVAAEVLEHLWQQLKDAQAEAARRQLAGLAERAETDLAAQAEIEKLKAGHGDDLLDEPDGLKLEDIIHMAETQAKKDAGQAEPMVENYLLPDSYIPSLQRPDSGMRQEFENLKLASSPGTSPSFPKQSDREGNRVKPHIQEKFEDLVGDLLEEEDEMKANYETYNLNAAFNINEPGDIGKQAGDLNSTAASAATGNMKPPTNNVGGASRVGRQGARAHGAAMGNESINRRGRDKVQEGQQRSPDQEGSVKETKSDDPQEDTSTGIGGRKVESDDAKFSLNDAGEWSDDMAERMQKPQDTHYIVERQGGKLAAEVGELMRDMNSKQEQTLERLKSIRKDLKNLYLPTEHLDELIGQMQANLHSLNERPSVEIYRLQQQTLEQLKGALAVFHQAHAGFQQSLPREQAVRGRVRDNPSRAVPPGYEEAVAAYYRRLVSP